MGLMLKGYIGYMGGDLGIVIFMFFKLGFKMGKIMMINIFVRNLGGVKEFYDIWYMFDEYEKKLNGFEGNN